MCLGNHDNLNFYFKVVKMNFYILPAWVCMYHSHLWMAFTTIKHHQTTPFPHWSL